MWIVGTGSSTRPTRSSQRAIPCVPCVRREKEGIKLEIIQWIIIILIILFVLRYFIPSKGITNITVEEAKNKFKDKSVQFIDVRTPSEYQLNHRKPFKNIPLANLPSQVNKLDKQKEVVVICQSGMRSARAANMLKKRGFEQVYNVKGGMSAWY